MNLFFAIIVRTCSTIKCYDAIKLVIRSKQVITKLCKIILLILLNEWNISDVDANSAN